jgi:hypothetical protein
MMDKSQKITLLQQRDFTELFNVSFRFLRQNFKPFLMALLFIAGPFILIGAILSAMSQTQSLNDLGSARLDGVFEMYTPTYWLYLGLTILFKSIAGMALVGVVVQFFRLYKERGPNGFDTGEVSRLLIQDFGRILLAFLLVFLLMMAIFFVIGAVMIGAMALNAVFGAMLMVLLVIAMLIFLPPTIFLTNSVYMAVILERRSFGEALARSLNIMRGNFWMTWVIVFLALLIVFVAGMLFAIPAGILQFTMMLNTLNGEVTEPSLLLMTLVGAGEFLNTLLYSVMWGIMGFQFYNLVEKRDGTGLQARIDEIGSGQSYREQGFGG